MHTLDPRLTVGSWSLIPTILLVSAYPQIALATIPPIPIDMISIHPLGSSHDEVGYALGAATNLVAYPKTSIKYVVQLDNPLKILGVYQQYLGVIGYYCYVSVHFVPPVS
jgi:hypothetical protein